MSKRNKQNNKVHAVSNVIKAQQNQQWTKRSSFQLQQPVKNQFQKNA